MTKEQLLEEYLTVEELLGHWKIDRRTLDKLIEHGGLECFAPPVVRVRRFPVSIIRAYQDRYMCAATTRTSLDVSVHHSS